MASRPLNEIVEAGWAKALEPVAGRVAAMGDFLRAEIAAGRTYLPAGANVLRAFQQPFDEVRVLIVGQDPYPTPGHAVGLSFSVAPEVRPLPECTVSASVTRKKWPKGATGLLDLPPFSLASRLLCQRTHRGAPPLLPREQPE